VEEVIRGKQLIIVPSGPLTQLPFQVLVTASPASGDAGKVAWLIRGHALTVLPGVSSLKALRLLARPSAAEKPMIGFGDPLLDGPDSRYRQLARLARENQLCPATPPQTHLRRVVSWFGIRGTRPIVSRGLSDGALLKSQVPLPETRDELCAVARELQADVSEIRLGARATEAEVKRLSASGALATYRIVHFATHGALAGELDASSEPGLILTPPDIASEEDDGYLTASEIAALKLDAEWVILSACNTAAGGATDAEALSGLARAFFYAQARALLVSHWAVDSAATVKLVTAAVKEIAQDKGKGRAEALRRAMLTLADNGTAEEAHPAFWAPFVLVGEGGTAR
jgi:CHAT domain-containing protein